MLDLYNNPNDKKTYELNYHKKCSPLLEEIERQLQTALGTFDEICNDRTALLAKPTTNEASNLIEKSKNHII